MTKTVSALGAGVPRALVIEDDDDVRQLLSSHLSRWGWLVEDHRTGEDGLRAALERPPALVVLDLVLPGCPATR